MSDRKVRVRFAPSPTGPLHIGGVKTALYCYLFAKKNQGDFILRIEDTDQSRLVEGTEEYINESLTWCGLEPDESPAKGGEYGPYKQSERNESGRYKAYAEQLISAGHAYYAFDTFEDLESMRERLKAAGGDSYQYDAKSRMEMNNSLTMDEAEVKQKLEAGDDHVIRIKMPADESIRFNDLVRGDVVVNSSTLDDKVLMKSDGMPTYHLANVADDHEMQISHVIRGEEWLPSAPMHVMLYKYLGWEDTMPEFVHIPLILKPNGQGKLSKRDGDKLGFSVFPLEWKDPETGNISTGYKEDGYLPSAFLNMVAMLGWNPGTEQEIFTLDEMINAFSFEQVQKSGARFDPDKAIWFNQEHIKSMVDAALANILMDKYPNLSERPMNLEFVCGLMKERVKFIPEIYENGKYFFEKPNEFDEKTLRKKWKENTSNELNGLCKEFMNIEHFNTGDLQMKFDKYCSDNEISHGALMAPLRLAITGQGGGPPIFNIMNIIGREESISRMQYAIDNFSKEENNA